MAMMAKAIGDQVKASLGSSGEPQAPGSGDGDGIMSYKLGLNMMMSMDNCSKDLSICVAMGEVLKDSVGMDSDSARAVACFASDMVNMQPPPPGMVIGGLGPNAIEPKNEGLMIVVAQKFDGSGDVIIASQNALCAPHRGVRVMSERQLLDMEMIVTSKNKPMVLTISSWLMTGLVPRSN